MNPRLLISFFLLLSLQGFGQVNLAGKYVSNFIESGNYDTFLSLEENGSFEYLHYNAPEGLEKGSYKVMGDTIILKFKPHPSFDTLKVAKDTIVLIKRNPVVASHSEILKYYYTKGRLYEISNKGKIIRLKGCFVNGRFFLKHKTFYRQRKFYLTRLNGK